MGAIAGVLYPDPFQITGVIDPMLGVLSARCRRRSSSRVTFKNLQLGAVGGRVATSVNGKLYVALDGKLSNRKQLKKALADNNMHCTSQISDSQLVLAAYSCWGHDFVEQLDGEFALVVFDEIRQVLFLARDRIGIKPLYWYHGPHHFIFGSELKSLLVSGVVPQGIALDGLAAYLYFGYLPQDMTAVPNVNKLLPGHYLKLNLSGTKSVHQYWSYSSLFQEHSDLSWDEATEQLDLLIDKSLTGWLPKDGNVGCFTSGGLGSSAVAYYAAKHGLGERLKGYSAGFAGDNDEDLGIAREVCGHLDIPCSQQTITPEGCLEDLVRICWHLDEPFADVNTVATWQMSKLASGRCNTVLSGMGSDEVFASHTRYLLPPNANDTVSRWLDQLQCTLKRSLAYLLRWATVRQSLALLRNTRSASWQTEYLGTNALFGSGMLNQTSPALARGFNPEVFLHKFYRMDEIRDPVDALTYFDVKTRLPDLFIHQYERLTTANRLEWHAPFLNQEILALVAKLSHKQIHSPEETGLLLRKVMQSHLPDRVIRRPKVPRQQFLQSWSDQPELRRLFVRLRRGALVGNGLITESWIDNQLAAGASRSFRHMWGLLMLEIWYQLFIENPVSLNYPEIAIHDLLGGQ